MEVVMKTVKQPKQESEAIRAVLPEKAILTPPYDAATNATKQVHRLAMYAALDSYEEAAGKRLEGKLAGVRPLCEMANPTWSYENEAGTSLIRGRMAKK
eukprot:12288602-Alexandrium_andersonii.AAC.1